MRNYISQGGDHPHLKNKMIECEYVVNEELAINDISMVV